MDDQTRYDYIVYQARIGVVAQILEVARHTVACISDRMNKEGYQEAASYADKAEDHLEDALTLLLAEEAKDGASND